MTLAGRHIAYGKEESISSRSVPHPGKDGPHRDAQRNVPEDNTQEKERAGPGPSQSPGLHLFIPLSTDPREQSHCRPC